MRRAILLWGLLAWMLTAAAQTLSGNFRQMSLVEVLEHFNNEQNDYTITFIHNDLEHLTVTTRFKNLSVAEAVEKVCEGLPVKVKSRGHDIFVQYKPQKTQKVLSLRGKVLDSRTHHELPGAMVYLMTKDSTVIDSCLAKSFWADGNKSGYWADFHFAVPQMQETYLMSATFPGHEVGYMTYTISTLHKREFYRQLPPLYLMEQGRMLKEVVVTASKVKFYHRGDTVVYDASAFQLAEGSMLDALVKQLPGVELQEDGRIYHNGKFVESLLLNGKEFFRGDNRVMLDNLPAYTVKDIKIYDKYGEKSEFLGRQLESDKQYVMDVQLKKEYSIGYLANLEAAGGTADRYLSRLFAMRFSDHSRLAAYANANNLNDGSNPTEQSLWRSGDAGQGMQTQQRAGIDYDVADRNQQWRADGNVRLVHTDNDLQTRTHRVNFLSSGDTYERSQSLAKDHSLFLSTDHIVEFQHKMMRWVINPKANYRRIDNRSGFTSSAFTAEDSLIHHNTQQGITRGHDLFAGLSVQSTLKFKNSNDYIDIGTGTNYTQSADDRFNRQQVTYAASQPGEPADQPQTRFTDQYFKGRPDWKHEYWGYFGYTYFIKKGMELNVAYSYNHKDQHRQQSLYLLDRLDRRDPLGVLPSVADYERTMDFANSHDSHLTENSHDFRPTLWWFPRLGKGSLSLGIFLPFTQLNQRLHYQQGDVDTTVVRHTLLFHPSNSYAVWQSDDRKYSVNFAYRINATAPSINYLVDVRDTSDPLNVHLGNRHLHNTYTHSVPLLIGKHLREKQVEESLRLEVQMIHNALSMSYLFDDQTGIRTYRPVNVNGNWNGSIAYWLHTPLDRPHRLTLDTSTRAEYIRSIDLTGTTVAQRSKVGTLHLSESIGLEYKWGPHRLGLETKASWRHMTSPRTDFETINAIDGSSLLSAHLALPWQLTLDTSLATYLRRGYNDPSMNNTEWCWNARLSRSFLKGNLILMLDGFDLLDQLSNVTQTMNAQGRTETWTNTLHRYLLVHAVYRMSKQPKRKP